MTAADPEPDSQDIEQARHRAISVRVMPLAELARWLFERYRIPYREEAHAPILHIAATFLRGGGAAIPTIVSAEGVWKDKELLDRLDAKTRPGERLLGEAGSKARARNRELIGRFLGLLFDSVPRFVNHHMLPHKALLFPVSTAQAPAWERALVWTLYPLWRLLMRRALSLPQSADEARHNILAAFDAVEAELKAGGKPFLGGDEPGIADIVFAALAGLIVFPPRYGVALPPLEKLPADYRDFIERARARPAGVLVRDTYDAARPLPQSQTAGSALRRSAIDRILGPRLFRLLARIAVAYAPAFKLGKNIVAARWHTVHDVLRRDVDFGVAPLYGHRMTKIKVPFVLGFDSGSQMAFERPKLYDAVARIDPEAMRGLIAGEAEGLLREAVSWNRRIDVVNGYSRLVAARSAARLFGIRGPSEADFMRVARAVFHYVFLSPDAELRGQRTAAELGRWLAAEIARRRRAGDFGDDVMGWLMTGAPGAAERLDDDGVMRNVAGLLVGAIDTTATTVAHIVAMIGRDRALLARIERDAGDKARLAGWCREALRLWPHNPMVLRQAGADTTLGGVAIPAGSKVFAFTQAAMFDPAMFPGPNRLDPSRAAQLYFHFGSGLHSCAGRALNDVQVPELVGQLVRQGIERVGAPRFDGPYIDELVVTLRRGAA